MKTKILKMNRFEIKKIRAAADVIKKGGLVAFPTETVYGLGANALSAKAVRKIFRAKRRPFDDPLIVHICSEEQLYLLTEKVTLQAHALIDKFWPGPLTIILKKSKKVPKITTGGLESVAIRMPDNKIACSLICESKVPIAAPSANLFGKPSPTNAEHVIGDLNGRIDAIIDAKETKIGLESTVIDLSTKTPLILRPGKISLEQIEKIIGKVKVHPFAKKALSKSTKKIALRYPGMMQKHYAPDAEMVLIEGLDSAVKRKMIELVRKNKNKKIGILLTSKRSYKNLKSKNIAVEYIGPDPKKAARNLFRALRNFNSKKVEIIFAKGISETGLGVAVMNRLRRAATRIIGRLG